MNHPRGHVLNRLPTIVEDDEEVDTIIPDAGIAIMPDTVADRGAISYEGVRYVLTVNNPATNSPLWGGGVPIRFMVHVQIQCSIHMYII